MKARLLRRFNHSFSAIPRIMAVFVLSAIPIVAVLLAGTSCTDPINGPGCHSYTAQVCFVFHAPASGSCTSCKPHCGITNNNGIFGSYQWYDPNYGNSDGQVSMDWCTYGPGGTETWCQTIQGNTPYNFTFEVPNLYDADGNPCKNSVGGNAVYGAQVNGITVPCNKTQTIDVYFSCF